MRAALMIVMAAWLLVGAVAIGLPVGRVQAAEANLDADTIRRIEALEKTSERRDHKIYVSLTFFVGVFCALWAQNTNRNPWLWFFFGWVLSLIALALVLTKNRHSVPRGL